MSLETTVLNLAVEVRRRLADAQKRDAVVRQGVLAVAGKIAVGAWLLAGNLLRVAGGNRVLRQRVGVRPFTSELAVGDEIHVLETIDHAVQAIHWQLALARRRGAGRRSERLIADFVDLTELDLARLSRLLKA